MLTAFFALLICTDVVGVFCDSYLLRYYFGAEWIVNSEQSTQYKEKEIFMTFYAQNMT